LIEFALCELREPSSGGHSVLLRLAELMFVEVVLRHLETMAKVETGWLAGLHDPLVARVLSLLHGAPAARWTLEGLSAQAGTSRSVLAERFGHFVGQPPIQYLTRWRMQLATRLLVEPGAAKVAAVAEAVGYESEAAFSRAFKKCVGMTPGAWRLREAA
jgi:AraC-like DNA-binding protein